MTQTDSGPIGCLEEGEGAEEVKISERQVRQLLVKMRTKGDGAVIHSPTTTVDLQNPQTFGKVPAEARTADWGRQPIMHLTLALSLKPEIGVA